MMTPDRDPSDQSQRPLRVVQLCPADGLVLDATLDRLSDQGTQATGHDSHAGRDEILDTERGRRIAQLLKLLDSLDVSPDAAIAASAPDSLAAPDDLVARTMARIAVAQGEQPAEGHPAHVPVVAGGQTDFDVLDELLQSGAHGDMAAARGIAQTERGRRVSFWLDLIDQIPAEPPADDLVARTLSRIAVRDRREAVLARIDEQRPAGELLPTGTDGHAVPAIAFRWNELIAVAAVLMIAVSLLWPIMARTRTDAMRIACASNMRAAGEGMRNYAWDNLNILPRYSTIAGSVWWNVGQPVNDGVVQSNSAHLYKLRREGYASITALSCPTNGEAPQQLAASAFDWPSARAVSYSYQNQFTEEPTRVSRVNSIVVLADKNPLFTPGVDGAGLMFNASHGLDEPGVRHSQPGQNVLVIDGSVRWADTNSLNGDNFYTVQDVKTYRGTETPTLHGDSFVVP